MGGAEGGRSTARGVVCERKPLACTAVRDSELRASLLSHAAKNLPSVEQSYSCSLPAVRSTLYGTDRLRECSIDESVPCLIHAAVVVCAREEVRGRSREVAPDPFRARSDDSSPAKPTDASSASNVKDDAAVHRCIPTRHPLDFPIVDNARGLEATSVRRCRECSGKGRNASAQTRIPQASLGSFTLKSRITSLFVVLVSWYRRIPDDAGACSRM